MPPAPRTASQPFGQLPDGTPVELFTLSSRSGLEVRITNYGGTVLSLLAPDQRGERADVVLGFKTLDEHIRHSLYFGAIIGRYANRIAGASFDLDGRRHHVSENDGANQLHGGVMGFDKVIWSADLAETGEGAALRLSRTSPDGEEGFAGRLETEVRYTVTDGNQLVIDYEATTDAPTPVCLTHHSYFNLAGHDSGDALGHRLWIDADRYLPVSDRLIPTGELADVTGTPFDFRIETPVGERIAEGHPQLVRGGGYDHCYVLNKVGDTRGARARLVDPDGGRTLEVTTTEPGLQFFSGNVTVGGPGKSGRSYPRRAGLCLEPQHFPDSPNRPAFPSTILRPGETYRSRTVFAFGYLTK